MAKLKTIPIVTEEEGATPMVTETASIASDGVTDPPVAYIANEETDSSPEEVDPNPTTPEPTLTLSVNTKSVGEVAGSFNINVTSNSDWTTSDVPNWITLTPAQGNGDKTVKVAYLANTANTQRSKAIIFNVGELTQTLNVTQDAATEQPPEGEEPDDFADQILKCFPHEELMYIDRQGGMYVKDTKEYIRKNAVLYKNSHFNKP